MLGKWEESERAAAQPLWESGPKECGDEDSHGYGFLQASLILQHQERQGHSYVAGNRRYSL